jgi:hypothetical protein
MHNVNSVSGQLPPGLIPDPRANGGDVHRIVGVDLQHRAAQAEWTYPGGQGRSQLGFEAVIDVTGMPKGCPAGEAAFDLGERATAEDLNRPLASL